MIGRDAERDPEQEGRKRARAVVFVEVTMNDDEDLESAVLELALADAQAPEVSADALEVLFEDVAEELALRRGLSSDAGSTFHTWVLEAAVEIRHRCPRTTIKKSSRPPRSQRA